MQIIKIINSHYIYLLLKHRQKGKYESILFKLICQDSKKIWFIFFF